MLEHFQQPDAGWTDIRSMTFAAYLFVLSLSLAAGAQPLSSVVAELATWDGEALGDA